MNLPTSLLKLAVLSTQLSHSVTNELRKVYTNLSNLAQENEVSEQSFADFWQKTLCDWTNETAELELNTNQLSQFMSSVFYATFDITPPTPKPSKLKQNDTCTLDHIHEDASYVFWFLSELTGQLREHTDNDPVYQLDEDSAFKRAFSDDIKWNDLKDLTLGHPPSSATASLIKWLTNPDHPLSGDVYILLHYIRKYNSLRKELDHAYLH